MTELEELQQKLAAAQAEVVQLKLENQKLRARLLAEFKMTSILLKEIHELRHP